MIFFIIFQQFFMQADQKVQQKKKFSLERNCIHDQQTIQKSFSVFTKKTHKTANISKTTDFHTKCPFTNSPLFLILSFFESKE